MSRPRARRPSRKPRARNPNIILAFDWFDQRVYEGIFNYAQERGWHLSPYMVEPGMVPRGWPGDGAITCFGKHVAKLILSLDMPKVDISVAPIPQKVPRVVVDNAAVGRLAANHFIERGFRNFAFYSWPGVVVNQMRRDAFFAALAEAGIAPDHCHEIRQSSAKVLADWEKHEDHIGRQIAALPRPLAVFTGQDNLGATLVEICLQSKIHVPEEVSILGVDNVEFLCKGLAVPLSSIDTRLVELGRAAAQQLDNLMAGRINNNAPPLLIQPKEVVTRRSTEFLAVGHEGLARALAFMNECAGDPITLEDVCASARMSKRGLEKVFLRHLKQTPAAELRRIRLDRAKRMLVETDEKIDVVARACGYSNSSNLSVSLRRDSKLSPRDYRRKFGEQGGA